MGRRLVRLNYEQQILDMEWRTTYKRLLHAEAHLRTFKAPPLPNLQSAGRRAGEALFRFSLGLSDTLCSLRRTRVCLALVYDLFVEQRAGVVRSAGAAGRTTGRRLHTASTARRACLACFRVLWWCSLGFHGSLV